MSMLSVLSKIEITPSDIGYSPGIRGAEQGLDSVLYLVYTWAGIIAVLVIVIAGLLFVTARGDASQMKRAKDAIRGAVIGLIVVIAAFAITRFVIGGVQG